MVGCGDPYMLGIGATYAFEKWAQLPSESIEAAEFASYRHNLINERTFSDFNKFHTFSRTEILSIIEQECKFFEKIIEEIKPEIFIASSWANFHQDNIFLKICKFHNIKCLFLHSTRISAKKSFISESYERTPVKIPENYISKLNNFDEILTEIKNEKRFKSTQKMRSGEFSFINKISALIKFLFSPSQNHKSHYTYFGRTKLNVFSKIISTEISSYRRKKFLYENVENIISNNDSNFVSIIELARMVLSMLNLEEEGNIIFNRSASNNPLSTSIIPFFLSKFSIFVNFSVFIKF